MLKYISIESWFRRLLPGWGAARPHRQEHVITRLPPCRAGAAGRYRWQASGGSVAPHRRGLPTRTGRAVDTGPMYTMDSASVNCEARAQTRHRARAPRAGGGDLCESPAGCARPALGLAPAPPPPNSFPAHVAGEPKAAMPRAAAGVGAPPQG